MQPSDRTRVDGQQDHLKRKYVGTGYSDITKFEWAVNHHRDSYASFIGHHSIVAYMSIAENEPIFRTKYNMLQKMVRPCGPPPKKKSE